jgi:hypothetical protein
MSIPDQKKSRRSMLMVLAAFIIPVILAKFALNQQWFNEAVTNHGELIADGLTLSELGVSPEPFAHKWILLYVAAKPCQQICNELLHSINNTYVALGEEVKRVTPLTLTTSSFTAEQQQQLSASHWQYQTLPEQAKHYFDENQLIIIDPLGNVVLRYLPPSNVAQLAPFGTAILADLKKLLKYSRIG